MTATPHSEDDQKRHAFAAFKQRIAELTGTKLDANGELDEDALTIEQVRGAMAVIQAELAVYAAPERAEMEALDDEILTKEITEAFFDMPEEDRNTIRRLMDPSTPEDEREAIRRKSLASMSEDDRNEILQAVSEDERNHIRRLMHMDGEDES